MAVTGYKSDRYTYNKLTNTAGNGQQVSTDNTGLRGVSSNTQQQQAKYQQGYSPSQTVTDAQQRLNEVMAGKPAGYNSKYGATLDGILAKIQNPEEFSYSFNNDPMFKYYADLYTQKGRQASMDAMGQAAGLTGGYGNSYAQAAGNQAYQQYLLGLYDKGTDFMNAAYDRYQGNRTDLYNQLAAIQGAEDTDYGRYRDTVSDWENERDYYTNAEEQAYNRDYGQWSADRDYWNSQAQAENTDWWNATNFNEQMRQNDAARQLDYDTLNAENQYKYDTLNQEIADSDRQMAYNYVKAILATGQTPSTDLLAAAGLSLADYKAMIAPKATATASASRGTSMNSKNNLVKDKTVAEDNTSSLTWRDAQLIQNADKVAQAMGYSTMNEAVAAEKAKAVAEAKTKIQSTAQKMDSVEDLVTNFRNNKTTNKLKLY